MGRIVVTEFIALDGVVEDPHLWTGEYWGDDIAAYKQEELFASDALLLGRVTYDGFVASWPQRSGDEYTDRINAMPKHVVSRTVTEPTWNTSVISGNDVPAGIRAAADADGQLLVFGSGTLVSTLIEHELVDELRLLTYPVTVGSGARLFAGDLGSKWSLAEARPFASGAVVLTYQRA